MGIQSTLIKTIKETIGEPKLGAEIGVFKGETSKALLEAFPNLLLHLVDPWKEWDDTSLYYNKHRRNGAYKQSQWDKAFSQAMKNVDMYIDRVWVHRLESQCVVKDIKDTSLDFAFVDANHAYAAVKEDIEIWTPKVKKYGLILGHDYNKAHKGVIQAVNEIFGKDNFIVNKAESLWSYVKCKN